MGETSTRPSRQPDTRAHEHDWAVEYQPDPMSSGSVVRSGDLICERCGATTPDRPTAPVCRPKIGWLSGQTYCNLHGRDAGWPCTDPAATSPGDRDG